MAANGATWDRHRLDGLNEPLFLWVARGSSALLEATHLFMRGTTMISGRPHIGGDGLFYHFTGSSALEAILTSDQLWSTEYRDLKDDMELKHSVATGLATLDGFADELSADTRAIFDAILRAGPPSCYVTSFSLQLDSRKHWLEYADNEAGGAIGLEPTAFTALIGADPFGVNVCRIAYRDVITKGAFLHLAALTDELIDLDQRRGTWDPRTVMLIVQHHVTHLLPLCKEWKFRSEDEARLVIVPAASQGGSARSLAPRLFASGGRQFQYVTTRDLVPSFSLPIHRVVLGRRASSGLVARVRE